MSKTKSQANKANMAGKGKGKGGVRKSRVKGSGRGPSQSAGRSEPVRSERAVMFAPWRHTYIKRTLAEETGCPFCVAINTGVGLESLIVYKGQTCSVILNKFPYNNGHTMVIPHRHTADFDKLTPEEHHEMHALLKRTFEALKIAYQPHGVNIGMNLGRVGGAGIIDHLHYHLVPRWNGDTNFMPVIGLTKVISESLEETYKKLLPLFS
jgi:ATP adenylyltransferase